MSTQFHESAWPHLSSPHWHAHGGTGDFRAPDRTRGGTCVRAAWTPDAGFAAAPEPHVPGVLALLRTAVLAVDAADADRGHRWLAAMEPAVAAAADAAGLAPQGVRLAWPRTDVLPPRPDGRFLASLHEAPDGGSIVLLAGDADAVLPRCGVDDAAAVHAAAGRMMQAGLDVLAIAEKERPYMIAVVDEADVQRRFRLRGLLGIGRPRRARVLAGSAAARAAE